jgi:uncharacterized membrane protein
MTRAALERVLEWSSVAVTVAGAALTSLNYYPLGPIMLNVATVLWLVTSIMWRRASLIAVNSLLLTVYTVGLAYEFFR